MLIIPVIDLSGGLVVHAKQGQRQSYQPVTSVLTASADPEMVLTSILELYPFKIIYIADLDEIQETGSHRELILSLARHFKQCEFWLDAGIKAMQDKSLNYSTDNIKLILGSENKLSEKSLSGILDSNPDILLSLDFNETGLIENPYLLQNTSLWTNKTIVMMLDRVGSNKGLDINRLNRIISMDESKEFYAAGGVQDKDDLVQLESIGIKGVLLASALHNGAITKEDLESFCDS